MDTFLPDVGASHTDWTRQRGILLRHSQQHRLQHLVDVEFGPGGHLVTRVLNPFGAPVTTIDELGEPTRYTYGAPGTATAGLTRILSRQSAQLRQTVDELLARHDQTHPVRYEPYRMGSAFRRTGAA